MAKKKPTTYKGNQNLKGKEVPIRWTKKRIAEYEKCKNDIVYFSEKYIKIVHVDHGLIPITLYDYQKEIIEECDKNRRVTVVTSRQAGKTTTAVCIILHYVLFNPYKLVALLANKQDSAVEIMHRIKVAYEALPKWMQQGVVKWEEKTSSFENGSKIIASATGSGTIRGKSCSMIYIDEAAFVERWDEFSADVLPTISSGKTTRLLLTSTPNGLNHFYKTCEGARTNVNGYGFVEVPWWRVPGRDDAWKQETLAEMDFDQQKFAQEYEAQFLGSSNTLISGGTLKALVPRNPIDETAKVKIYHKPENDRTYVCVVDVSRGKGLDYSAFTIIDTTEMPYRQVCTFRDNNISPIEYAEVIYSTLKYYNHAVVMVEINDIGEQVSDLLHYDFEHENIIFTESAGRAGKRISTGFKKNVDKGIRTTKNVKSIGCSILKLLVEQQQLIINDFDTISELSTFSRKNNSYEADPGCHDDLAMCLVLFAWLSDQRFFEELTDIHTLKNLREKTREEMEEELLPFGILYDGIDEAEVVPMPWDENNDLFGESDIVYEDSWLADV